jgi:hypothetical protein
MSARAVFAVVVAALVWASSSPSAVAQEQGADGAECKILEVQASNTGGGVDPALKPLARKLSKPPFSAWDTFKLIAEHDKTVTRMKALDLALSPGGKLSLLYRDRIEEKKKKVRLRFTFTLEDKNGKRRADGTINADSGDYFMIGGTPVDDGSAHILAISCAAK